MPTRLCGIGLLAVCALAIARLHAVVTTPPRHPPSGAEMILSLVVVLTALTGALASLIGPALFETHPRRSRLQRGATLNRQADRIGAKAAR
jgi:hypothetical protein